MQTVIRARTLAVVLTAAVTGCTQDRSLVSDIDATSPMRSIASRMQQLRGSDVDGDRLGCVAISSGASGSRRIAVIEGPELKLPPRRGALHESEFSLGGGIVVECFLSRRDDKEVVRSAIQSFRIPASRWRAASTSGTTTRDVSRTANAKLASAWLNERLNKGLSPKVNSEHQQRISLTIGGVCPSLTIYTVGSCVATIRASAGPNFIFLDFSDIAFKIAEAPQTFDVFLPSEEQLLQWAICQYASEMVAEFDDKAQRARLEADEEARLLGIAGGAGVMCEKVLSGSLNEYCVDLFIAERYLDFLSPAGIPLVQGRADDRGFNANARRNTSRVQINFDPQTLHLNAHLNTSDVEYLANWVTRFGPDGGKTITNEDVATNSLPGAVRQLSFTRIDGDPNTALLQYDLANNVCDASYSLWAYPFGSFCPTITGRWRFDKGADGQWRVNTQLSYTDTYPNHSLNKWDYNDHSFKALVEIQQAGGLRQGLDTFQQLESQMRQQQEKIPTRPAAIHTRTTIGRKTHGSRAGIWSLDREPISIGGVRVHARQALTPGTRCSRAAHLSRLECSSRNGKGRSTDFASPSIWQDRKRAYVQFEVLVANE